MCGFGVVVVEKHEIAFNYFFVVFRSSFISFVILVVLRLRDVSTAKVVSPKTILSVFSCDASSHFVIFFLLRFKVKHIQNECDERHERALVNDGRRRRKKIWQNVLWEKRIEKKIEREGRKRKRERQTRKEK